MLSGFRVGRQNTLDMGMSAGGGNHIDLEF